MIRISPSQISTWASCNRAWGFDKLDGIEREDDPSTAMGTEVHDHLAWWGKEKRPPDPARAPITKITTQADVAKAARIATRMLADLPVPLIERVEEHLQFNYDGITYHGYADAIWTPDQNGWLDLFDRSDHVWEAILGQPILHWSNIDWVIRDHKTTSDLKWIHARDVVADAQRIIYSYAVGGNVLFEWGYGETRSSHAQTHVVRYYATRKRIEIAMRWLHETYGVHIVDAVARGESDKLHRNFSHCAAYRGCKYLRPDNGNCHEGISPSKRIAAIVSAESLKEKLAKRRAELGLAPAVSEQGKIDTPTAPLTKDEAVPTDTRSDAEKAPKRRGPGRPPGSKNKPKDEVPPEPANEAPGSPKPAQPVASEELPAVVTVATTGMSDRWAANHASDLAAVLVAVASIKPPARRVALLRAALVLAESES